MAHRRAEDLNLSLTGSQLSVISARSRSSQPVSSQSKRANSMVDVRPNKLPSGADEQRSETKGRRGSFKGEIQKTSSLTSAQSLDKLSNGTTSKAISQEDDFLALFESSPQPKIKQALSGIASSSHKKNISNKPSKSSAGGMKPRPFKSKPAWASKPSSANSTARTEEPHNIFRPASVQSTDDDFDIGHHALDDHGNSLTNSITKLRNLQNQISDVNKQQGHAKGTITALDSYRSAATTGQLTPGSTARTSQTASIDEFIQDIMDRTPRHDDPVVSDRVLPFSAQSVEAGETTEVTAGLANNISRPGHQQKVKATLSSMENSYHNIKHKTPVNQVKSTTGAVGQSSILLGNKKPVQQSNVNSVNSIKTLSQKTPSNFTSNAQKLEDYINTLNSAAAKIQKWFRRHRTRHAAAEAAMRRLLSQKKLEHEDKLQKELAQSMTLVEMEEKKVEERRKLREEKAKEARQQAIKDLKKKREEHKIDVKKKAEDEIKFLQASGRISKSPSSSVMNKKRTIEKGIVNTVSPNPASQPVDEAATSQTELSELSAGYGAESGAVGGTDKATEANTNTRTTLEDLYSTLKKLEEEENFLTARPNSQPSWLNELEKDQEGELGSNLTAENLEKLNSRKDGLSNSGFLTNDKLRSIINFLDEVHVTDRLSEIDTEISRMNEDLEKPALLVPSASEIAQIEHAQATASEVTNTVLSQRLELDEKKRTVTMLQKALNQQRELTVRHARETEKEMKKRLDIQKEEYEEAIKRHLSFIDQLIDDKKNLGEKCEKLVTELKTIDKKYQEKIKSLESSHVVEMTKVKEVHSAAEKLRREKWIEDKTKKIKEMTVKGLEPEIQRLISKHKSDIKKIKQIHEAELLESDERAAQKYVKMTEELRDQLAAEKEAAIARERESSKLRYEKQLEQEEEAYQQKQRRLYQEVQEEKQRLASASSRQRSELEKLQRQLEDNHRHALEAMKEEFDKSRDEQEKRHKSEIRALQEKLKLEKESWEENYMKRHETWLVQKEREIREQIKKERDKEIEMVIERLEEDASTAQEANERSTEQKIRRLREKFETETRELEQSERKAVQKYNEMKAKMTEVEGENERLKVIIKQKDQEILDSKKLLEKMNSERSHVSDIIRQEFADRIVATDEENKRIKHEISELRARHRIELEKAQRDMEELRRVKDEEMEEVHKRVKAAIVKKEEVVAQLKQQYQAANKRADHLEGLLEQQRKQLLNHK
ncbi:unnamed protein product [Lymnaea stagnalis]|uniref:Centrosomal protein of 131 kDa n=1 Tax=Lymnaea stagnalis TaxID=6523 RepID=A0AAV2INP4_LYMST